MARAALETIIYKYGAVRMADAPCGGMKWQGPWLSKILEDVPCFTYRCAHHWSLDCAHQCAEAPLWIAPDRVNCNPLPPLITRLLL